jgi:hypothetical protein
MIPTGVSVLPRSGGALEVKRKDPVGVQLPFQVPTGDDGGYAFASMSTEDLTSIRQQARDAAATYAEMDVSDVSPDDIETMRELTKVVQGVDQERTRRSGAAGSFAALSEALGEEVEPETGAASGTGTEGVTLEAPAATTTAAAAAPVAPATAPGVAAVAAQTTPAVPAESVARQAPAVILAGANNPDYATGTELDWNKVGKLVEKRFLQYNAASGMGGRRQDPIAQFKLEYPAELTASGGLNDDATPVIDYASSEKRLPGGSLLASLNIKRKAIEAAGGNSLTAAGAGWCAPSEVLYDLCELESNDGLLDIPEINVSRGGIKYTTGPDFSAIYSGAGYFHYTETQVITGVTKPTMSVPCPSFTDTRLEADGLAIQADLLQLRGYPELIARFVRGAMVAHTHKINQFMINALVTGSTALALPSGVASHTPGAGSTWFTDHSVVSTLLSALDLAITDYKYRQRMQQASTLEVVLPYWVQSWIRSDISRKAFYDGSDGVDQFAITMNRINDWLTVRGARVQWVYDWQDAFYWAAYPGGAPSVWQQFGGSTATTDFVQDWPHTLQFLLYAAGTWVRGNADIITLDTVYDSTLLAQNKTTQLFTEQGILAAKTCFDSRVYSIGTGGVQGGLIPDGAAAYALNAQSTASTTWPTNP